MGVGSNRTKVRSAFIAAPFGTDIGPLKEELGRRGIVATTSYEMAPLGINVADHVESAIRNADLIVAVLASGPVSNVLYEIGFARGARRQLMVLVDPAISDIPADLNGLLYVRIDPGNREALGFALDQLLARPRKTTGSPGRHAPRTRPLGSRADKLLEQLRSPGGLLTEREMLRILQEALEYAGLTVAPSEGPIESGVDLAVWSDELGPWTGNPLIIEIKRYLSDPIGARKAFEQTDKFRKLSNSKWALLVAETDLSPSALPKVFTGVLFTTLTNLLNELKTTSFPDFVKFLRNEQVHGSVGDG